MPMMTRADTEEDARRLAQGAGGKRARAFLGKPYAWTDASLSLC